MTDAVEGVKKEILEAAEATVEYANAIRQIKWDMFDRGISDINNLIDETEFLAEMLREDAFDKDTGKLTASGIGARGLYVSEYQMYKKEAKSYAKEIEKVKKALEADPKNTTLLDRYSELLSAQRQAIKNTEEQKKKIQELYKEGYENLIASIQKLIDQYKKANNEADELHKYNEEINEKTGAVNKLQKQILAYSGNETEENRATLQKLTEDLKKAQKDLEETEREKSRKDQEALLDAFMEDLQEWMDGQLSNVDKLLDEAIKATNANAETVKTAIDEKAGELGLTTSTNFDTLWTKFSDTGAILKSTNTVVNDIKTRANKLPTAEWQKGELEGLFGNDSNFIHKLGSIRKNTEATKDKITETKKAINNVKSKLVELKKKDREKLKEIDDGIDDVEKIEAKVEEYTGDLIPSKIEDVEKAIEEKQLSVVVNVDAGGGYDVNKPDTPETPETPQTPETPEQEQPKPEPKKNYWVSIDYDPRGFKYHKQFNDLTLEEAQRILNEWKAKGYGATLHHYAKGGVVGADQSFLDAIAQLLGEDHMVAAKEGERVLTAKQNKNFEKMVSANFTPLNGDYSSILADKMIERLSQVSLANTGKAANVGNTTTVGDINITLPNVTDKQDFINWLKSDGQIEKIIQSMTVSRMLGGNSYTKLKY